jgi:uncharacterized protein YaaR (DUF327 family)
MAEMLSRSTATKTNNYMGKKAQLKKLRRQAAELPDIWQEAKAKERVSGEQLREMMKVDKVKVEGDVDPGKEYIVNRTVAVSVNHTRRMKKAYMRHGDAGIAAYKRAVKEFVTKETAKQNEQAAGNTGNNL